MYKIEAKHFHSNMYRLGMIKLEGCIYELIINNRPYIGQSRALDKERLPSKRWKRHIADSKSGDAKMLYIHRAINSNGLTYDTMKKHVLEYVEQIIDCPQTMLSNILSKKDKCKYKRYASIITGLLIDDAENSEEINEYLETEDNLTEEESSIIKQIDLFLNKLNNAEEKWVNEKKSMMPERGGNGYNHAPPGGAFLHEPHTEEHKAYMSNLMKDRKLSDATKELLRKARTGKPLSDKHKEEIAKSEQKRFNEEIFPRRYAEWVSQYEKLKYSPDSNSEDTDERRAGQWRQDMISKRICRGCRFGLSAEQIELLTKTPGWLWAQPDEFIEQFQNFKKQYIAYNGKLSTSKKDPEHMDRDRAINWIRAMRMKKRKNDPYLTKDRIQMLDDCDYWSWKSTTFVSFEEQTKIWAEFYKLNKSQPSMGATDNAEKKLARWQTKTRMDYHNKEARLTKAKIDNLNSVDGWTWKGY